MLKCKPSAVNRRFAVAGCRVLREREEDGGTLSDDDQQAAGPSGEDRTFRLLYVCTGNICRSAFAEILTRHLLIERLGSAAPAAFSVSSAGTHAVVGGRMHPNTCTELRRWSGSPMDGFAARQLSAALIEQVDLVLGIEPRHRSKAVEMSPAALSTGFSLREFAYLAESIDVAVLPVAPVARAYDVVERARGLRGIVLPRPLADLRVPDPMGGPPERHRAVAELVASAVFRIMDVLAPRATPA
jgi:low molecular weight protein-tyrosine phosphatase